MKPYITRAHRYFRPVQAVMLSNISAPEVSNNVTGKINVRACDKQISRSLRNCYHESNAKLMRACGIAIAQLDSN